jgi:hypothetical protein
LSPHTNCNILNGLWCFCSALAVSAGLSFAQTGDAVAVTDPGTMHIDKRLVGVLPNYKTVDGSLPFRPITAKQKMLIATKDSFDYPVLGISALFAGVGQWQDSHPQFGQGASGFGKRYLGSYTDQALGNFMTEGILPSLLHLDPRYFRVGAGNASGKSRLAHAMLQVFVTRTDSGSNMFNFAEAGGYLAAAGISNAYYKDSRRLSANLTQVGTLMAVDIGGNLLKEFLPDLRNRLRRKHAEK